jgi:hypothetical protein
MSEIIVITEERLKEIIREVLPSGTKISPEDKYVTTEQLTKILKVSAQMINTYKNDYGMTGSQGENLWDWEECLRWRREEYSKITRSNRKPKN